MSDWTCMPGHVEILLDSQWMNCDPNLSAVCYEQSGVFFWPFLSLIRRPAPVTSSPMLIQLFLHRLTCCSLITLTQRWRSGDLLATTTQIGSQLVREQSAVTFNLLWVCVWQSDSISRKRCHTSTSFTQIEGTFSHSCFSTRQVAICSVREFVLVVYFPIEDRLH